MIKLTLMLAVLKSTFKFCPWHDYEFSIGQTANESYCKYMFSISVVSGCM